MYIEKLGEDVVLCGDFNLRPDTKSMEILDLGMRNHVQVYMENQNNLLTMFWFHQT
ncbi:MAG: hypothetical protein O2897_06275 [bacterium]|nr:hypothetical protein [bacterium]